MSSSPMGDNEFGISVAALVIVGICSAMAILAGDCASSRSQDVAVAKIREANRAPFNRRDYACQQAVDEDRWEEAKVLCDGQAVP